MNTSRSSTRKRQPKLLWPNDPRWDIRIGLPQSKVAELLMRHSTEAAEGLHGSDGLHNV
ncbi:hypothetical protein [Planctomicrobium piriforme]|uniref:hypothetical protein n=1 Tax=Planctomicrobium piriforme TaxID=1576369 RepID=UPI0015873D39|nr:hypothetical protein [Planctomicrobium piriforme]